MSSDQPKRGHRLMNELLWVVAAYLFIVAAAFAFQRKLMYLPDTTRIQPAAMGLSGVEELTLSTSDGEKLVVWHAPARPGKPTLLYFHGNAGNLASRADRARAYSSAGYGLFMVSYRGYAGSTGSPSEQALVGDAVLAYDALAERGLKPDDIVFYGESLGSGVVVQLAMQRKGRLMVLEAPFSSAVDVAAGVYWFLPVRLLMWDRFESIAVIGKIAMPLAVLHGERDGVVPVALGRKLYAAASEPKELWLAPGAGHEDLYVHGAFEWIVSRIEQGIADGD